MDFSFYFLDIFSKRRCLKFDFYTVSIACLQPEIDRGEIKPTQQIYLRFAQCYFYMDAYKCDVVAVTKMGACIHWVLILCGCVFYGI